MAELKLPRLLAAAKEFNVGQDTLIDFLKGIGFPKEELKPTSKLTEEMYRSLQLEFQTDKAAKIKSDQLELPKGTVIEAKKKKEEEEIVFKKEEKTAPKIIKKEEQVKPVEEETPIAIGTAKVKTKKDDSAPLTTPKEEEVIKPDVPDLPAPKESIRAGKAGIEGPKVVKKIDLSTIDSSTRPKKGIKTKRDLSAGAEKTTPIAIGAVKGKAKKGKKDEPKVKEEIIAKAEPVIEEHQTIIENIEVEKLTGPKILGKIELPIDSDTRPVKDEKRKRKRIPIEKKEVKRDLFINKEGDKKPG